MDRTTKIFLTVGIGVTFVAFSLAFPILWAFVITFVIGTLVGGGTASWYGTDDSGERTGLLARLFKQFRNPQKTDTPRKRTKSKKGAKR